MPKTIIKLKSRYIERNKAEGGDLTKLKTTFVVQTLVNRKWSDYASFDSEGEAEQKSAELHGLTVDIS